MKQTVTALLLVLITALGFGAFSSTASAAPAGREESDTTCTGRLVAIRINALEDSGTTTVGSDFDVTGQVTALDREALGLQPAEDVNAVIDFIRVQQNGTPVRTIPGSDGFFRGVVLVLAGTSQIVVSVSIDSGDDLEDLTCKVLMTNTTAGESEATTTTTVAVPAAGGGVVPTTVPSVPTNPSVLGATATATTTAAPVQGELALTGKSSLPLGLLGVSLAALGAGLLLAQRKLRLS